MHSAHTAISMSRHSSRGCRTGPGPVSPTDDHVAPPARQISDERGRAAAAHVAGAVSCSSSCGAHFPSSRRPSSTSRRSRCYRRPSRFRRWSSRPSSVPRCRRSQSHPPCRPYRPDLRQSSRPCSPGTTPRSRPFPSPRPTHRRRHLRFRCWDFAGRAPAPSSRSPRTGRSPAATRWSPIPTSRVR